MNRRELIKNAMAVGFGLSPITGIFAKPIDSQVNANRLLSTIAGPRKPITIYNNWSSYDELSDNIPLTETLAMNELDEMIRLKKNGVSFDYYMMDAFWFDREGGFRTWHKKHWPDGPDRWLEACKANDIKPGMWFPVNDRIASNDGFFIDMIPEWNDSATTIPNSLSLFRGGFLKHLIVTLQMWADKGVKAFKFDFANFSVSDKDSGEAYSKSEIEEMNKSAFIDALKQFRQKNPDLLVISYNGFGGEMSNTYSPFHKTVDSRWLEVFDTLYCGDPKISDVPAMNIWRSQDIFTDHMVRQFEFNEIPLKRIDNCGFMIGVTGTCYNRANNAWKGMQILELARGGWVNVFHGNLELLSENDAQWFARTQKLYMDLQKSGMAGTFGGIPGKAEPYGFLALGESGSLCTIVNPSQAFANVELPVSGFSSYALLYADGGYSPLITGNKVTLGPEQLVVVGLDEYADEKYYLGIDQTVRIPYYIQNLDTVFKEVRHNAFIGRVNPVKGKDMRILFQQFGPDNFPRRSNGGSPPNGKKMDEILKITVTQDKKPIPHRVQYDKMIWSGLSWAAGEVDCSVIDPGLPVHIECCSTETEKLTLKVQVYAVSYKSSD
jgi:hypothetical protein